MKIARPTNPIIGEIKRKVRGGSTAYTFMRSPDFESGFEVGETVEAFCDHEKNADRIRGWLKGIVVQVDNKMVAVQFRSNVFLTDGWMVPDRILWYPTNSEQIRPIQKKSIKKEIPDY
jgi:hypothetical protein